MSSCGQVRSLLHDEHRRSKILAQPMSAGYPSVTLYLKGDRNGKKIRVHKLVMLAFVGPCPQGQEVRHLDDIKTHTYLENLEYGTRSQNAVDVVLNGNNFNSNKTHCPKKHEYTPENTIIKIQPNGRPGRWCRACYQTKVAS